MAVKRFGTENINNYWRKQ